MALDLARMRSRAATWLVALGAVALVVGVAAFVIAARPCRLSLEPGQIVTYRLTTSVAEEGADGRLLPPKEEVRDLSLVCVGGENEVALVSLSPGGPGRDEVTMLSFAPDGSVRCLDPAARPTDAGKAFGFFDFNLLPLPEGSANRPWEVSLVYAALPAAKRQVTAKVKRTKAGSSPEFQLRFPPSVEWVNERNRYVQIRDLVCLYRYNGSRGLVDAATVKLTAGVEGDEAVKRYQVTSELRLASVERSDDDPRRLRDLALATSEAEDALDARSRERLARIADRLQSDGVRQPQLRELARRLAARARGGSGAELAPRSWQLVAAQVPAAHRADAEALARKLVAGGQPARVLAAGGQVSVRLGPYAWQDPAVVAALVARFPALRPVWVEAK